MFCSSPYCLSALPEGEEFCPWDSSINGEDDDYDDDTGIVGCFLV